MYLRPIALADIDFIAMLWADAEVMRDYPSTLTREQAVVYIERTLLRYVKHGVGPWLAINRATDMPIGIAGLIMQKVHEEKLPEIGYAFWKDYWRQGLASEAALAIRDYAFHELSHPIVISLIPHGNAPSEGVAKKIGMQPWKTSIHDDLEHIVFRVDKSGDTSWQKAEPTDGR